MTAITVAAPRRFDLTFENCETNGIPPLYTGATWSLVFRVKDSDGEYVELSAGTIVTFVLWDDAGTAPLVRDSDTAIPGEGVNEIEILSDQATTNKGRYRVWFRPSETVLAVFIQEGRYEARRLYYATSIEFATGSVSKPHFKGRLDLGSLPT